jgi:hypothetical protein
VNSKQLVAALSVVILVVILTYPALSSGTISVDVRAGKIDSADHLYVTIKAVWVHEKGQSNASGWKSVFNGSQMVDLATGTSLVTPLATNHVSAARYDAVRFGISNVTWVFNKTTTTLLIASPNIDATVDFTLVANKSVTLTVLLGGHQELIGASKFFQSTMTATVTGAS